MANPFFNAKYYLEKNADVAAVVGDDAELAEQHYFLHGASEALNDGLVARQPAPWFDIEFYANSREDLADVPAEQLFLHFVIHGMREGLSPMEGVEFDADTYLAANEDLVEALGIEDPENLTADEAYVLQQHFFAHGYREGREGGPEIPGYDPDEPDTGTLTEALEALQAAQAAEKEALAEIAKAVNAAEEKPLEGDALKAFIEGYTATDAEADVTTAKDAVIAQQAAVDEAVAKLSAMRNELLSKADGTGAHGKDYKDLLDVAGVTDAKLTDTVINSIVATTLGLVRADAEVKSLFDDWNAAKAALASDQVKNGSEEQLAKALIDAMAAYVSDGGTAIDAGDVGAVTARYTAEQAEAKPNWVAALADIVMASGLTIVDGKVTDDLADGEASVSLQNALASAAEKSEARGELIGDLDETDPASAAGKFADKQLGKDYLLALELKAERDGQIELVGDEREDLAEVTAFADALDTLLKDYNEKVKSTESAEEALEELGVDHLVTLDSSPEFGTANEADLYLYVEGNDVTLSNFEDIDSLFIGQGFTRLDLDSDIDIASTSVGDASVLEVFFQQSGSNVVVTIENETFGGNATGLGDVDQIVIVGVNLEDVSFNDGFITVA